MADKFLTQQQLNDYAEDLRKLVQQTAKMASNPAFFGELRQITNQHPLNAANVEYFGNKLVATLNEAKTWASLVEQNVTLPANKVIK